LAGEEVGRLYRPLWLLNGASRNQKETRSIHHEGREDYEV
jgi:hypothetical protein